MLAIIPWLGALAFGAFAVGCAGDKKSPRSPEPVIVKIPKAEPQKTVEKPPTPPPPPEFPPLCFAHHIHGPFAARPVNQYFRLLEDLDPNAKSEKASGILGNGLVSQMDVQGRIPLGNSERSADVFVKLEAKLYDYHPGDGFRDLFFTLQAFQCDSSRCDDGEEGRLKAQVLPIPVRLDETFANEQLWTKVYVGSDDPEDPRNHLGAIFGYEQTTLGVIVFVQSDPARCVSEDKKLEEVLADDPLN